MITPGSKYGAQPIFGTGAVATGTVAGAATYRSDWVDISASEGTSFDVTWSGGSGAPAGTLSVEVSNQDAASLPGSATACNTLSLVGSPAPITGNSGFSAVDVPVTGFRAARLVATVSAGTFALTALAFSKRIGGL